MAEVYTGEIVQNAAGAQPYSGEVVPLAGAAAPAGGDPSKAVTGRAQIPAKRRPVAEDRGEAAFIGGNLSKGVANIAGLPVDTAANVLNLGSMGLDARDRMSRVPHGDPNWQPPFQNPVGGSEWIQNLMRRGGMIGPGAEPQSAPGRYAAAALQAAPSALAGRPSIPQIPRAIAAAGASGLGAEAARDVAGDEYAGVGAMLPGAGKMQHKGAGERATQARQADRFGQARELGIPVPPRDLKVDKPQQKAQSAITKQLGLPEGTELSPEILKNFRGAHYDSYAGIINDPALQGQIQSTPKFQKTIRDLAIEERKLRTEFPNATKDTGLQQVLSDFVKPSYSTEGAMAQVQRLREGARNNLGSASATDDTRRLGLMQRRIANAMEDLIGENVQRIGKPELTKKWQESRQAIAQSHDVEAALEPGGKINASRLAALQADGQPLSGQLKKLADVAGAFPTSVSARPKNEEFFTHKVTPMALQHPPAAMAHWSTRMWDPLTKSGPAQRFAVDPASRLTPQQQQMLHFLSAATASNRIPTPPE